MLQSGLAEFFLLETQVHESDVVTIPLHLSLSCNLKRFAFRIVAVWRGGPLLTYSMPLAVGSSRLFRLQDHRVRSVDGAPTKAAVGTIYNCSRSLPAIKIVT
jgi:hypothetical protein